MFSYKPRTLRQGKRRFSLPGVVLMLGMLMLSGWTNCNPPPPNVPPAANPDVLCFPQFSGLPDFPNPPQIDGTIGGVPGDLGWNRSSRYFFGNGTSVPDAIVQIVRDNSFIYLSFEVNNDPVLDEFDAIVLVFSPGGGAANDRRIIINPNFSGAGSFSNLPPNLVRYWNNSGNWNNAAVSIDNPAWLINKNTPANSNSKVSTQQDGPNSWHWYVEIKIPINNVAASNNAANDTGINIPANGNFGFYFDIIRIDSINNVAEEFAWPNDAELGNIADAATPEGSTPAAAEWGAGASSGIACNGVNFDWYDIKIEHPGNDDVGEDSIALNATTNVKNIFKVTPHNDSVDANGSYISAQGVKATFKIRNYGLALPEHYKQVGDIGNPVNLAAPNPTSAVTIPAAAGNVQGVATLSMNNWKLNASQETIYSNNASQCILVELGAEPPAGTNVAFKNKSALRNMHFVETNSPFSQVANLSTAGYKPEQGKEEMDFILNSFTYYTTSKDKWDTKIEGASDLGNGQYLMRARPEQDVKLAATISPPQIQIPSTDLSWKPNPDGQGQVLSVRVKPGDLVTILTEGSFQVRKTTDPNGAVAGPDGLDTTQKGGQQGATVFQSQGGRYPLPERFEPARHVGGLIGSWDNFGQKTFLVGSLTTLKVPKNTDQLVLGVNDTPEGFREHSGEGFKIQVIVTPMEQVYTNGNSMVSRDPELEPIVIPVAVNLPTWILCGQRKTNKTLTINKRSFQLVQHAGCYGYAVRRMGLKPTGK